MRRQLHCLQQDIACAHANLPERDRSIDGLACLLYLRKMPIRISIALLAFTACTQTVDLAPDTPRPEPKLSETTQSTETPQFHDVCGMAKHACNPLDPASQLICDDACLLPSYCLDYYASDYRYCAAHPDTFDRYYRYCDPNGNPAWNTYCVEGFRP